MTKPAATAPAMNSAGWRRAKSSVLATISLSSRSRTVAEKRSICAATRPA
jgi:hypothetical protein